MLPADLPSFLWGGLSVALVWFISSFTQAAGKDAWSWVKKKINSEPVEPIKVSGKFIPKVYAPGDCAWVGEERAYTYESEEYFYYPHPKNGAKCFREAYSGHHKSIEWLMVKSGSSKLIS